MSEQTEQDFRDIERDREIDTESGERPDDWADPELWNDEDESDA